MSERRHPQGIVELGGRRATDVLSPFEVDQDRRLVKLEGQQTETADSLKRIEDLLTPISETYSTVSRLGKWGMALAVLVSVVVGILVGLKDLFKK